MNDKNFFSSSITKNNQTIKCKLVSELAPNWPTPRRVTSAAGPRICLTGKYLARYSCINCVEGRDPRKSGVWWKSVIASGQDERISCRSRYGDDSAGTCRIASSCASSQCAVPVSRYGPHMLRACVHANVTLQSDLSVKYFHTSNPCLLYSPP